MAFSSRQVTQMNTYSEEDIKNLVDSLNDYGIRPSMSGVGLTVLTKEETVLFKQARIASAGLLYFTGVDTGLTDRLRQFFKENDSVETQYIEYFIYEVPFENVPLYINDDILNQYVRWRLRIAR